jgi:hypothetical protein
VSGPRRPSLLLAPATLAAVLALCVPAQAARPTAQEPVSGRVVPGLAHVRDGHASARRAHRATASSYGGRIRASNGEFVSVQMSDAYVPDNGVLQAWANFIAGLQHGSEISGITVYVAPPAEVGQICGSGSDGCYSTPPSVLTVPGSDTDSAYVELVAAHEYGHHVDSHRRNDPWDAGTWGPKYWATYENVCHRVRKHTAFPGNEGSHYSLNPDEAWAESFAVLNGYSWESETFDNSFKPDAGTLRQMKYDIHDPWSGNFHHRYKGRFRRGARRKVVRLPEPDDGRLNVRLRARGGDDLVLYTVVGRRRKVLKRARHHGSRTRLRFTICGQYPLRLKVIRRHGSGRFRMRVSEP